VKITNISPSLTTVLSSGSNYSIDITAEYHVPTLWDTNRHTAEIYVAAIKTDGSYETIDRDWVWFGTTRQLPGGDFSDSEIRNIQIPESTATLKLILTYVACGNFPEAEVQWQVY